MCRVGEAANPGPRSKAEFCLGVCNPSGLANKATIFKEFLAYADTWFIAETHLTERSLHRFRPELRFAGAPYRHCIGGHPVAARNHSHLSGQWSGVAVMSKYPTRALPHIWSDHLHRSSRIQVSATLIQNLWITCGTFYGETHGPGHPDYLRNNEMLLGALIDQVCHQSVGPRLIAGDFNMEFGDVPSFNRLHEAGFRDLQTVANDLWGQPVARTCKHATRKDFCFLSPELVGMLQKVTVDETIWPDHAVLVGHFSADLRACDRWVWNVPAAFPWPAHLDMQHVVWPECSDPAAQYHAIWSTVESAATAAISDPVCPKVLGRGRPIKLKRVKQHFHAPLHSSRSGELEPKYHGPSVQHAYWFRQLRRLQAYKRFAQSPKWSSDHDHALASWGAIRRAQGFAPSFFDWWMDCKFRVGHAPARLPEFPPPADVAQEIFESVVLAVRDLENQLRSHCKRYAQMRRANDANVIFQDIKPASPETVNLLMQPCQAVVQAIDIETGEVTLSDVVPWVLDQPVWCRNTSADILHAEDRWIWLSDVTHLRVGDMVTQVRCKGLLEDLRSAFRDAWIPRWHRHKDVPASQWQDIIAFTRRVLPHVQCRYTPLDVPAFRSEVHMRRKRNAKGMDGVSACDLRALPDEAVTQLCKILEKAETDGVWPTQLVAGRVASLAKIEQPRHPLDFRPITVLSLVYRIWGSFHCKRALKDIDHCLPQQLFGNRVGSSALQVWTYMGWLIEDAYMQQVPLSGLQADVQKAFNHVPRLVMMEACSTLGIPTKVLVGWAAALSQLERYFVVRDSLTLPVDSCTGVPEGDALSCLGMMALDCLFHRWHLECERPIQAISYVDDWQLVVTSPAFVQTAMARLESFCSHLDLLLDKKKTFAWSLTGEGRTLLKQQGFRIEHGGRMLGAHTQFTLQHTNSTLTQRFEKMPALWDRLRASHSPYALKVRAIRTAAWPNALHGVLSVSLGAQHIAHLRSGAMKGIQAEGSGVNPWLHLGWIEDAMTDPGFWSIVTSLRQARESGEPDLVCSLLGALANGFVDGPSNGLTSTLLGRIQQLGWHVLANGTLQDAFGAFNLFEAPLHDIQSRAEWAWKHVVSQQVSARHGMSQMHLSDIPSTRAWLRMLPNPDQALFRKVLNGAFFTEDHKAKWDDAISTECPFCQCTDGRFHRWWICEHFASIRAQVRPDVLRLGPVLPESLSCFGWSLLPSTWHAWQTHLAQIPEPAIVPAHDVLSTLEGFGNSCPTDSVPCPSAGFVPYRCDPAGFLDLFTDGSCWFPKDATLRFSAYAVIVADTSRQVRQTLCSGPLPGVFQSAMRAELFACREALRWARHSGVSIRLWVDCMSVVRKFQRIQHASVPPGRNTRHSDLWRDVFYLLPDADAPQVIITKVAAHTDESAPTTELESWCRANNAYADKKARLSNQLRPQEFWTLFERHKQATQANWDLSRQVQWLQLRISRAAVQAERFMDEMEAGTTAQPVRQPAVDPGPWVPLPVFEAMQPCVVAKYGARLPGLLQRWFWTHLEGTARRPEWISLYQLYIDFMWFCGEGGPISDKNKWYDPASSPEVLVVPYHFKRRCAMWITMFKDVMKHSGVECHFRFTRPQSLMLSLHAGCCWVPWPPERLSVVDRWIEKHFGKPATRNGETVNRLPAAWGPKEVCQVGQSSTDSR